mgnify:CR=1 FL=1
MRSHGRGRHHQRGAAILLALLIASLVATMGATALVRHWSTQRTASVTPLNMQHRALVSAGLQWAAMVLTDDRQNGEADHLNEAWAAPMAGKLGAGLAKTTGWIRRSLLTMRDVRMLAGVTYERIDDTGLHVSMGGKTQCLRVDTVVICAGQDPCRDLETSLRTAGIPYSLIGGADLAEELDAKRAIDQGTRLAARL